jgi:hypothetical protein
MKKFFIFFVLLFFLFSVSAQEKNINNPEVLELKYKAVAIGQVSLAYRLIALSTSLAIAKAVDPDYISGLLDNVDSTIDNCKRIVSVNNDRPDNLSKNIVEGINYLLNCSKNVKKYAFLQSYDNLTSVRECIDESAKIVEKLSDDYNKLSSSKTKELKQKNSK